MKIALSPKLYIRSSRNLRVKQRPPLALRGWATIALNQIQHGWRPPSWKSLWRHNSDNPLLMKFGTPMENHMPMAVKGSKSKPEVEFQDGGRLFSEIGSSNISAADWELVEGKTWVNSSKSDIMGIEVSRQNFSKFHSSQQNCNEP